MSTVVAVRKENSVAIAADTQFTHGGIVSPGKMRLSPRKIHRIGGAYVGIAGGIAHHSVVRSLVASRSELFKLNSADEIFETLRTIYPLLRENYYLVLKEEHENQEYESSQMDGLIINKVGIFSFSCYRDVSEYACYWATGSGTEYALGALEAIYSSDQSAKSMAETAVRAACAFDAYSGLPLESYELELAV